MTKFRRCVTRPVGRPERPVVHLRRTVEVRLSVASPLCSVFEDGEQFALAKNQVLFPVHGDFRARVLAKQHLVAF